MLILLFYFRIWIEVDPEYILWHKWGKMQQLSISEFDIINQILLRDIVLYSEEWYTRYMLKYYKKKVKIVYTEHLEVG